MSYQTRRTGQFGQQQNVGGIGQRRPIVTNNFVSGGQLQTPNKQGGVQTRGGAATGGQATPANTGIQFHNQQQQQTPQKQPQAASTPQQQVPPSQQQQNVPVKPQAPVVTPVAAAPAAKEELKPEQNTSLIMDQSDNVSVSTDDGQQVKKKPFWLKNGNKISKKERMRRRNIKLSKVLQPKNAVMILHELVKNTNYDVTESNKNDENQFKATVVVDGIEHVGYGRSKIQAKNAAAEMALKHFVKHNKLTSMAPEMKKEDTTNVDGEEKMDTTTDGDQQNNAQQQQHVEPLPWQHVASFALYKLFASWGEDPNLVKQAGIVGSGAAAANGGSVASNAERMLNESSRPAKKMPENPETINPLMLINQMLPHAQFEEIGKSGNPPNVIFSFKCTVDNETFVGAGPNKKTAKKMAAFAACNKILNITYPPDVYVPPLC